MTSTSTFIGCASSASKCTDKYSYTFHKGK